MLNNLPPSILDVQELHLMAESRDEVAVDSTVSLPDNIDASSQSATSAAILTPSSIQPLRDEFANILVFGSNFSFINTTVCGFLEKDQHAAELRSILEPFNGHMYVACFEFSEVMSYLRHFYVHNSDEFLSEKLPDSITEEQATIFFTPAFRTRCAEFLESALSSLQNVVQIMENEIIPRLPFLEKALDDYVEECIERDEIEQERSQSWIPTMIQDVLWGKNDALRWNISEIKALPNDLVVGGGVLRKLPEFLGRLRGLILQLSQLDSNRLAQLGYTTTDDLRRLYMDRLICHRILDEMEQAWYLQGWKPFYIGLDYAEQFLDHQG